MNNAIDNLFDVDCDNVHMVQVDSFEAALPATIQPSFTALATQKQLSYMKSLFAERRNNEEAMFLRAHLLCEYKAGKLTRLMASQGIEDILKLAKDKTDRPVNRAEMAHGQVWITIGGTFVKVCLNQEGTSFYGKHWFPSTMSWEYHPQALKTIDHIVTAEEAKEFSLQWDEENRYCVFCMKHLSDPRSEFAGYGKTCAENNGLPWGPT